MAKKSSADRSDPKKNKSLAIRNVLDRLPNAKAKEVADAVKKEYGHTVASSMIYMIKTKGHMAKSRKRGRRAGRAAGVASPLNSAALWVDAIKLGRQLLKATGSVENATALLKAVDS